MQVTSWILKTLHNHLSKICCNSSDLLLGIPSFQRQIQEGCITHNPTHCYCQKVLQGSGKKERRSYANSSSSCIKLPSSLMWGCLKIFVGKADVKVEDCSWKKSKVSFCEIIKPWYSFLLQIGLEDTLLIWLKGMSARLHHARDLNSGRHVCQGLLTIIVTDLKLRRQYWWQTPWFPLPTPQLLLLDQRLWSPPWLCLACSVLYSPCPSATEEMQFCWILPAPPRIKILVSRRA